MDLLQEVAIKYGELLNKDYHIEATYKEKIINIYFFFLPEHFYHLIGFHKLLDMKELTRPKFLCPNIISHKITYDLIKNSMENPVIFDTKNIIRKVPCDIKLYNYGNLYELN